MLADVDKAKVRIAAEPDVGLYLQCGLCVNYGHVQNENEKLKKKVKEAEGEYNKIKNDNVAYHYIANVLEQNNHDSLEHMKRTHTVEQIINIQVLLLSVHTPTRLLQTGCKSLLQQQPTDVGAGQDTDMANQAVHKLV